METPIYDLHQLCGMVGADGKQDPKKALKDVNAILVSRRKIAVQLKGQDRYEIRDILTTNRDGRKSVWKSNGQRAYACLKKDCVKIVLKRNFCSTHRDMKYEKAFKTTRHSVPQRPGIFAYTLQGINYKGKCFYANNVSMLLEHTWYVNPRMEVVCEEGKLLDLLCPGYKCRQTEKGFDYTVPNLESVHAKPYVHQHGNLEVCRIPLSGDKGFGHEAMVSIEDVEYVSDIKWNYNDGGYAQNGKAGLMHRFLMIKWQGADAVHNKVVDHKDGNRLNNTRENLRIMTSKENAKNKTTNPESGFEGVIRDPQHKDLWICKLKDIEIYRNPDARMCALVHDSVVTYVYGPGKRLNDNRSQAPIPITFWQLPPEILERLEKLRQRHTDYHGVRFAAGKWKAKITIHLGEFDSADEAAQAYDVVAILLGKNDTNFDPSTYSLKEVNAAMQRLFGSR